MLNAYLKNVGVVYKKRVRCVLKKFNINFEKGKKKRKMNRKRKPKKINRENTCRTTQNRPKSCDRSCEPVRGRPLSTIFTLYQASASRVSQHAMYGTGVAVQSSLRVFNWCAFFTIFFLGKCKKKNGEHFFGPFSVVCCSAARSNSTTCTCFST